MSDQFQHVMVLISIIIGLGITNLLLGLSGGIERFTENTRPLRTSWATVFWLAYLFLMMVLFWWWEFRLLGSLKQWSLWNYFLVICYAVVLFLHVALLIPRDWDKVDDMNEYFLAKRRWFYSVFALSLITDVIDSDMKGGMSYINETGILTWGFNFGRSSCSGCRFSINTHPHSFGDGHPFFSMGNRHCIRHLSIVACLGLINR